MSHQVIVGKTDLTTLPSTYGETLVGLDGRVYTNSKIMGTLDDGTDGIIKINNDGSLRTTGRKLYIYEASLAGGGSNSDIWDLTGAKRVRIYGNTDNNASFMIQYASVLTLNPTNYDWAFIDEINPLTINGNIVINKLIECPPKYLRLENNGGTHNISIRLLLEF